MTGQPRSEELLFRLLTIKRFDYLYILAHWHVKIDVGIHALPQWDMTCGMEEVGWSQAGVWRRERDHFINDDLMLEVTYLMTFHEKFLWFILCICTTESSIQKMAETCILWHPGHKGFCTFKLSVATAVKRILPNFRD